MNKLIKSPETTLINLDKTVTSVVNCLSERGLTIATAESCTGGLLSALITSVPGASAVFECGICSYSNRIKHKVLGVSEQTLTEYSEISEQTAGEMAEGLKKVSDADICVSVTGMAGPSGTPEHPVGTVYGGIFFGDSAYTFKIPFENPENSDRDEIRTQSAYYIFSVLDNLLKGV